MKKYATEKQMLPVIFVIALAFVFSAAWHVSAGAAEKIVRVGYYESDPYFQDGYTDQARKTGYAYEYLQQLSYIAGWKYEYVYGKREEMMDMLAEGKIDLAAGIYKTEKRMEQMYFSDLDMGVPDEAYYFAVSKKRQDIYEELNAAQKALLEDDPYFTEELCQTYYGQDAAQWALTDAETEALAETETLTVGYIRDNLPLCDEDKNGEADGVLKEALSEIASTLNVSIQSKAYDTVSELQRALSNNDVDAIFPSYTDMWIAESNDVYQTDAFLSDRCVVVYKGEYNYNLIDQVAVSDTFAGQSDYITTHYPNAQVYEYDTAEEAFDAVKNGSADCLVGCDGMMNLYISAHPKYQDLQTAYLDETASFGLAVKRSDSLIGSALNKAVNRIDRDAVTMALAQYTNTQTQFIWSNFIRENAIVIVTVLVLLFVVLLLLFLRYRHQSKAGNEEMQRNHAILENALNAANTASRAKSAFLSNISYDITASIDQIIAMTENAEAHMEDAAIVKECMTGISSSCRQFLPLVREVLDMLEIEAGSLHLSETAFEMTDFTQELVACNKEDADARWHEVIADTSNVIHNKVLGDPGKLQQALSQIINNAILYTPDGGSIRITVSEKPGAAADRSHFEFVVEDNGIGMAKDYLPHIFDIFSRADNTYKNEIKGDGLGMPIAQNIIRMMGGDIVVESTLGKGTKVTATVLLKITE